MKEECEAFLFCLGVGLIDCYQGDQPNHSINKQREKVVTCVFSVLVMIKELSDGAKQSEPDDDEEEVFVFVLFWFRLLTFFSLMEGCVTGVVKLVS